MNKNTVTGISLGMVSTIFWGGFYPISRLIFGFSDDALDALNFSAIRFILASLCLSPLFFSRNNRAKARDLIRHHLLLLFLLGFIGIVGEGLLVFWALEYTTAARASLMANTSPIWTLLISYFATHEVLTRSKIIGMLCGAIGILLVFTASGQDVFTTNASTLLGDLMALASGACWAYFTVYGGEISKKYGGLLCCEMMFLVGTAVLTAAALIKNGGLTLCFPWRIWAGALYLGLLSYGIANSVWYVALRFVTPGQLGSLGYVSAMLAMTCSILFLDEKVTWSFVIAIILVLGGVFMMLRTPTQKRE